MDNSDSISNTRDCPEKANQIIYSIFFNIKFLYEKTDNNFLDKYFCLFKLKQGYLRYQNTFKYLNKPIYIKYIKDIFKELMESNYISSKNKILIKKIKKKILRIIFLNNITLKLKI